jgi:hypothetical protein
MSRYKVLPSIAHNVAQALTRPSHEHEDDRHLLGDLLGDARKSGEATLRVDLMTGEAKPDVLVTRPLTRALARYVEGFPALVAGHGSDMQYVKAVRLQITFDLADEREAEDAPGRKESPYVLRVEIDDDRGKTWHAELNGWCSAGRTRAGSLLRQFGRG